MITIERKVCKICGLSLPLTDFFKKKGSKDGLMSHCKKCEMERRNVYTNTCIYCGKEFKTSHENQVYCSMDCKNKDYGKKHPGELSHRYSKIECKCYVCGKTILRTKSQFEKYDRVYCSKECQSIDYGERLQKENNPHWNENKSDEERQDDRKYIEYNQWRESVYKRDNFTCQCCGDSTGGNLNAHHLNSYNSDIEHRTAIENGITLCESCHKKYHKLYGYGNNTKEEFEEFMQNAC